MKPEIIEQVELELHGEIYPEPVRVREPELPVLEVTLYPDPISSYIFVHIFKKYLASPGVL